MFFSTYLFYLCNPPSFAVECKYGIVASLQLTLRSECITDVSVAGSRHTGSRQVLQHGEGGCHVEGSGGDRAVIPGERKGQCPSSTAVLLT